jgi:hypothetical protein
MGSLVALQAFAGSAGAATTRFIYVGYDANALDKSVSSDALVGDRTLAFTTVTAGNATASSVYVRNTDNQTLTHVVITILRSQGDVTVSELFGGDSAKCPVSTDGLSFGCDFGNLKPGGTKSFTMLLQTTSSGLAKPIGAVVTFNESTNPNGGNPQIKDVNGTLDVADGLCNLAQTYLRGGRLTDVDSGVGCTIDSTNPHSTQVSLAASTNSTIVVRDEDSTLCDGNLGCFGQASVADVAVDGTFTVTWTLKWLVASNFNVNQFGVLHFADGTTTNPLTLTLKKNTCKSDSATDCIVSAQVDGTLLTAVIRTKGNGVMRGFH